MITLLELLFNNFIKSPICEIGDLCIREDKDTNENPMKLSHHIFEQTQV